MHNRINNFIAILTVVMLVTTESAWAFCPPPATPQNCASIAMCATMQEDTRAMKDVDKGFVKKLKEVAKKIFQQIDDTDNQVSNALMVLSTVISNSLHVTSAELIKPEEAALQVEQKFKQEEKTLEALQTSTPGELFKQQTSLKIYGPSTEALTRAIRQRLYDDQVQRVELNHESFYSDKTNTRERSYSQGTIAGIAKLYETHRKFFCNSKGANKPAGCGEEETNEGVQMGDQMMEIYLGDGTWPKEQVQKAIELMQYYLGINPPDLPNTADLSTGDGQRAYMDYQGKLARNNFTTYMLSYLVARRAPTNEGQTDFTTIRKESAGCDKITDDNKKLCSYYDTILKTSGNKASMAEMDSILNYNRIMNAGFMNKAVGDTMGIEKDRTVMMADSLRQDYEEYQMDKMITAALAGFYASLVNGAGK